MGAGTKNGIAVPVSLEKMGPYVARDVSERNQMTEVLMSSELKFRTLAENSPDYISRFDTEGRFVYVNPQWEKITGLPADSILGKTILEVMPCKESEKCMDTIRQIVRTGANAEIDIIVPGTGKEMRYYLVRLVAELEQSGEVTGVLAIGRDITERKRHEEDLIKIDKLESLSILAGGIVHDFNNLLTAIISHHAVISMELCPECAACHSLDIATKACDEAMELSRRLTSFAKVGVPVKKTVSIGSLLRDSLLLHGKSMEVDLYVADDLGTVEADEGQLHQVFDNLVVNAGHAMPDGGVLRVKAENAVVDEKAYPELAPGHYVKITFADEGCGIDEKVLPKIFEPYFTTKPKGTGLGLASSYLIIARHGGRIVVSSRPSIGSIFTIYLPTEEMEGIDKYQGRNCEEIT